MGAMLQLPLLDIVTAISNTGGALTTSNGITLHVLGGSGATAYNPPVVKVAPPTLNGHELQTLPYRQDELVLIVPRGHALARRKAVAFEDTLDLDHVGLHSNSSIHLAMREAAKDQPIERVGAELRSMMTFLKKRKEAGVPEEAVAAV